MGRTIRCFVALLAVVSLIAPAGATFAAPKDKQPHADKGDKGKDGKEHKAKKQKHHSGKDLVKDKLKANGKHKFHENGKNSAFVNVTNGKIAGVSVTNADKGELPVTKYKTTKKMARGSTAEVLPASHRVQYEYIDTVWIGYAYIDEYGYEEIYWFPYDMIYDGDTGAIEYVPVY